MTENTRVVAGVALGALTASAVFLVVGPSESSAPERDTATTEQATTSAEPDMTPAEWCDRWQANDTAGLDADLAGIDHIGLRMAHNGIEWSQWGYDQGLLSEAVAEDMYQRSVSEVDAQCEQVVAGE